jgi:HD-GYP domain-containing protein (c-di-GMP phosphodiesterase class II)
MDYPYTMNIELLKPQKLINKILLMLTLVALAFVARLIILPIDDRVVYSTFYPVIAIIALMCGYRIGLFGALISGLLAYFFILTPAFQFKALDFEQTVGFATYISAVIIICFSFAGRFNEAGAQFYGTQKLGGRILLMLLVVGFAFLLRLSILPIDGRVIYSTFYPAIAMITLACGFEIGLIGTLLLGVLAYVYLLPPAFALKILNLEQVVGLLTYFVAAGIISFSLREVIIRGQKIKQVNDALQDLMVSNSIGKNLQGLVEVIASTVEMRDPYTSGHQRRVAELGVAIGGKMGLPDRNLMGIRLAGLIHDLGKMKIPVEILTKPGKLTDIEQALIREHPKVAYEALKGFESPWPLADIVQQHHERMDGSGYPKGLKGEDILIEARILAVADVVEAMSAMRPYREGLGIGAALNEIKIGSGKKYDEAVVNACVELFESGAFSWHKD